MGGGLPKQYLPLFGVPLIRHTVAALCAAAEIEAVFVVLAPDDAEWDRHDWQAFGDRLVTLRCGGETRASSVANGLRAMLGWVFPDDWILVHDAARACITAAQVRSLIHAVGDDEVGGILAVPVADTLKRGSAGRIVATVARDGLWQAQTPQMFRHGLLLKALDAHGDQVTDEAGAIEALGLRPKLVASDAGNLKVTWPLDLQLAEAILARRREAS